MKSYAEENARIQAEGVERARKERAAWQEKVTALQVKAAEHVREETALEAELAKTIAQLVDTPEGKKREELVYHFQELKTALEICAAEHEELRKRQARLYAQPPMQAATNYDPTARSMY